jgi:FSR family fosmidomycin resistance protein-like MFS transporter
VTPTYAVLVALLLASGLSVAALHVSIPVVTAEVAGKRIGQGMSFFMLGGELGRVAGPVLAVQAVALFGLDGIWRVSAAGVVASAVLWWRLRSHQTQQKKSAPLGLIALWKSISRTIIAVSGIIVARSLMAVALTTFLPTYLYQQGQSLLYGGVALTIYELAGAVGALTAGTLSDRLGRRQVLLGAVGLSPLFMFVFLAVPQALTLPMLAILGFVSLAIPPVLMAVMLESSPVNRAAANGTYMMLAFAVRSLVALAVGGLSDVLGMKNAYLCCAGLALLGVVFVFVLPAPQKKGERS